MGGDHDAETLYIPPELAREHEADARRTVADSVNPRRRPRAATRLRPAEPPRPATAIIQVHLVAALLVVALATITGTWGIGAAVLGAIGVSALIVRHLARTLLDDADPRPSRSRSGPDAR